MTSLSTVSGPIILHNRSFISFAALLVNVTTLSQSGTEVSANLRVNESSLHGEPSPVRTERHSMRAFLLRPGAVHTLQNRNSHELFGVDLPDFDEVRDPRRQHGRLAAARSGMDRQSSFWTRRDGFLLCLVQPSEVLFGREAIMVQLELFQRLGRAFGGLPGSRRSLLSCLVVLRVAQVVGRLHRGAVGSVIVVRAKRVSSPRPCCSGAHSLRASGG